MISNITDAYENIKEACDKALKLKYSAGIPKEITERYETELNYLKNSQSLDDFEIIRRLFIEAHKSSQLILTRGTLPGSFLFYLISNSKVNPLPAHYYCPKCGHYEEVNTTLFGIDLPTSSCPNCDAEMISDGVNITALQVWGNESRVPLSIESNVSKDFYPFARRVIQSIYPNNEIADYGVPSMISETKKELSQGGFVILPEGKTIDDYPDLVTYLDDGTKCIVGSIIDMEEHFLKKINLLSNKMLDCALYMQNKTGIYFDEINNTELKNITYRDICNNKLMNDSFIYIVDKDKTKTFKKMCGILSSTHSTYNRGEAYSDSHSLYEFLHSESFEQYPLHTREDMYDFLIAEGIDETTAFKYADMVRKGILYRDVNFPGTKKVDRYKDLLDLQIPEPLRQIASNCMYLFPRAHSASYLYTYAVLAYYVKKDSKAYSYYVKSIEQTL